MKQDLNKITLNPRYVASCLPAARGVDVIHGRDSKVFNMELADIRLRKNHCAGWRSLVEAKKGAKIAVKETDMLGEEVLVVTTT
jgi:hypothetical protein